MPDTPNDRPLPHTVRFVAILGVAFVIGWLLMFQLLRTRW
jgi:hypothetical protein